MEEKKVEITIEDIRNCCNSITSKILSKMRGGIVDDVLSGKVKKPINRPVLYRWWFPADFVEFLNGEYKSKLQEQLEGVDSKKIGEDTYYALYFGKSKDGRNRFNQHTYKDIDKSTLRRTIYAIISTPSEDKVAEILSKCYFEWVEVDSESLLECLESMCIVSGKYPLNIEGNPSITDYWRKTILDSRKDINNK